MHREESSGEKKADIPLNLTHPEWNEVPSRQAFLTWFRQRALFAQILRSKPELRQDYNAPLWTLWMISFVLLYFYGFQGERRDSVLKFLNSCTASLSNSAPDNIQSGNHPSHPKGKDTITKWKHNSPTGDPGGRGQAIIQFRSNTELLKCCCCSYM